MILSYEEISKLLAPGELEQKREEFFSLNASAGESSSSSQSIPQYKLSDTLSAYIETIEEDSARHPQPLFNIPHQLNELIKLLEVHASEPEYAGVILHDVVMKLKDIFVEQISSDFFNILITLNKTLNCGIWIQPMTFEMIPPCFSDIAIPNYLFLLAEIYEKEEDLHQTIEYLLSVTLWEEYKSKFNYTQTSLSFNFEIINKLTIAYKEGKQKSSGRFILLNHLMRAILAPEYQQDHDDPLSALFFSRLPNLSHLEVWLGRALNKTPLEQGIATIEKLIISFEYLISIQAYSDETLNSLAIALTSTLRDKIHNRYVLINLSLAHKLVFLLIMLYPRLQDETLKSDIAKNINRYCHNYFLSEKDKTESIRYLYLLIKSDLFKHKKFQLDRTELVQLKPVFIEEIMKFEGSCLSSEEIENLLTAMDDPSSSFSIFLDARRNLMGAAGESRERLTRHKDALSSSQGGASGSGSCPLQVFKGPSH